MCSCQEVSVANFFFFFFPAMGQEFHVVQCYSCMAFQSQQMRKDKKFVCKICGEKQSVKKVIVFYSQFNECAD